MKMVCLDLEGVLIPEIWLELAKSAKIDELMITTREIPDYDVLMKKRIEVLKKLKVTIHDIQKVISTLKPLEGAYDFLSKLRDQYQVIILSDTYYEFMLPMMKQLQMPTIFCHSLILGEDGIIQNYKLRLTDQKTKAVKNLKDLNFNVVAAGDSYNDIGMIKEANNGFFFKPPTQIMAEYPEVKAAHSYDELLNLIDQHFKS